MILIEDDESQHQWLWFPCISMSVQVILRFTLGAKKPIIHR